MNQIITNEQKQDNYSDFFKDVFGHRPRHVCTEAEAVKAYDEAASELQIRKATPEGRARLRADGWVIPAENGGAQ